MAQVKLKNIKKSFGNTDVLKGINLDVQDGEFVSLVGESGCGKSTLLRIIAGLETADTGEIFIDGRLVNEKAPKERNIAMVFQDYALYPHMSVAENIAMPLIMARLPLVSRLPLIRFFSPQHYKEKPGIRAEINKVAQQLKIDHLLDRRPAQLSGGQRQRTALGRALVRDPKAFLMDEPLSNLDAKLRVQVRREITELHAQSGLTFIYVTHDQTEAMTMSDQVALMQNGEFLQVGHPNQLYTNPDNVDVARLIGSPEINITKGEIVSGGVQLGGAVIPVDFDHSVNGAVQVGIRPEAIFIEDLPGLAVSNEDRNGPNLNFVKTHIEDLGHEVLIHGRISDSDDHDIRIRAQKANSYSEHNSLVSADIINVQLNARALLFFDMQGGRLNATFNTRSAEQTTTIGAV